MKRTWIAAAGFVGVGVACALAGPLDKARVDAGAKWLVHADVEAVMRSTTGRFIAEHRAELDLGPLEEFKKQTGLDAFRDIKDVTVYGMSDSPEEAIAMLWGTAKLEAAVDALMGKETSMEKIDVGGRSVFKWMEDGSERYGHLRNTGDDERSFVVSRRAEQLERAMKVLDGTEGSLANVREGPMAATPRTGAMVYVVVSDLGAAAGHAPRVLRSAQEVRAEMGEDDDGFYGEVKLKAGAEEDVRNMADFGRGLLAVGRMASAGDPELKDLAQVIDGVKLEVSGGELTASFRIGKELLNAALTEIKSHQKREGQPAIEKTSKEEKR